MKGKMNTDMGEIIIDRDVLAKYAGTATTDCIGIVGMAAVNMKDGDIIEQGNHEELMKKGGFYADLYNSQFEQTA